MRAQSVAGTASTYCDRLSAALLLPGERLMIKAPVAFVIGYGNALHEVRNRQRCRREVLQSVRDAAPSGVSEMRSPNAPDAKFCAQCGAALGLQSAAGADASVSPVARGSVRLGPEPLEDSPTLDGERKTVTALFADIKGSTELMEDLDRRRRARLSIRR
jgi:hypothetical protein